MSVLGGMRTRPVHEDSSPKRSTQGEGPTGSLRTGEACNATVRHIVRSHFETPGLSLLVELTSVALVKLPELTLGPQIFFIIP
jgi:hypothetical protein